MLPQQEASPLACICFFSIWRVSHEELTSESAAPLASRGVLFFSWAFAIMRLEGST
jgi:hypothetical protein